MKRYLALIIFACAFFAAQAQDLYVYSMVGKIKIVNGKVSSDVSVRQTITSETVLNIEKGAKIVLVDQANSKQYTFTTPGVFSVDKLIAKAGNSTKELSKAYLSYVMKQISGNGVLTSQKAVDGGYASIERDADDSLFVDFEVTDSISNK